jgi:hypothetical protein
LLTLGLVSTAASAKRSAARERPGMVVDGERFTLRKLPDASMGGMPALAFLAPEKWRDRGQVHWNYGNENPVSASGTVEDPESGAAYSYFPQAEFFALQPNQMYQPGQAYRGAVYGQPIAPIALAVGIARQIRGSLPGFKLIGTRELPGLAAALGAEVKGARGVGVKVSYESSGKPFEEEIYGIYYRNDVPYDGPQGRSWQTYWGLTSLHGFRAPAGTLDRRRPVFAAIAKSFRPNPQWVARYGAITAWLAAEFNRQLQAGYDQIAAAGRLSAEISANNDQLLASIDRQLRSSPKASSPQARSSADKWDDYIRGVDTVEDPRYGTSQHSDAEAWHWTDGYGAYRNSNDPSFDPNRTENGGWTLMQPAH